MAFVSWTVAGPAKTASSQWVVVKNSSSNHVLTLAITQETQERQDDIACLPHETETCVHPHTMLDFSQSIKDTSKLTMEVAATNSGQPRLKLSVESFGLRNGEARLCNIA
jgi:hypothetical protein